MNELLINQKVLCKSLGRSPKKISKEPLISQAELKQLQEQVEELNKEYFHRLEKYTEIKITYLTNCDRPKVQTIFRV